jgi:8-oxo-dGTP pyrophosphatase MutT (NUDIX family)
MAEQDLSSPPRHSNVAYVLVKLRVRGVDHLLLRAHPKWGDWSLVGGHVEPSDRDFHAAAAREVQEEMAPLRFGDDLEVDTLSLPASKWGPVPSMSAGGAPTTYHARWYFLRFKTSPTSLLAKLPKEEFLLVPVSDLDRFRPLSAVVVRAKDLGVDWRRRPLAWESDLEEAPLPPAVEVASRVGVGTH